MLDSKAVDTLFDRASTTLPVFVPALPSLKLGIYVGLIVFLLGSITCWREMEKYKLSEDPIERTRWLFILLLTVYISGLVTDFVRDKHYKYVSVSSNVQHYANVAWLSEYMRAIRS